MRDKKDNVIVRKTFDFACEIVDLEEKLVTLRKFVLSKQVAGSGMSIGANTREAQRVVSKADFINKLGIALKEAEETEYWFEIIEAKVFKLEDKLKNDLQEIIRLLVQLSTQVKTISNNKILNSTF